jgi:hypothetical protein
MIAYTNEERVILTDNNRARVIGSCPVFTKNEKFSELLSLFGDRNHIDCCYCCNEDRKDNDRAKDPFNCSAPGWKNLVTDSSSDFGKRKIKPFFGVTSALL